MENRTASLEPVVRAYQALVAMPAVGIRAADWIVCRPTQIASSGDLICARLRGAIVAGRFFRGAAGRPLFCDGRTGECQSILKSDELEILGVVIAVRGEYA